jgi:hypothetical protein
MPILLSPMRYTSGPCGGRADASLCDCHRNGEGCGDVVLVALLQLVSRTLGVNAP